MTTLASLRDSGWSYSIGWSQEQKAYLARAWKGRPRPHRTEWGVLLLLHVVSATADCVAAAGESCAAQAAKRDAGDQRLSEAEMALRR